MNHSDINQLLHGFADGELEPAAADEVRRELDNCAECRASLAEIVTVRSLAREAFVAPVEDVDFSGLFDGVLARIDASATDAGADRAQAAASESSLAERLRRWFGEVFSFERPLAALSTCALVAAFALGVWYTQKESEATDPGRGPSVARQGLAPEAAPAPSRVRRPMEGESFAGRNAARVESYEVVAGRVVIEDNVADPEQPIVVWHLEEDPSSDTQGL